MGRRICGYVTDSSPIPPTINQSMKEVLSFYFRPGRVGVGVNETYFLLRAISNRTGRKTYEGVWHAKQDHQSLRAGINF
jgi:hypothetical protein